MENKLCLLKNNLKLRGQLVEKFELRILLVCSYKENQCSMQTHSDTYHDCFKKLCRFNANEFIFIYCVKTTDDTSFWVWTVFVYGAKSNFNFLAPTYFSRLEQNETYITE